MASNLRKTREAVASWQQDLFVAEQYALRLDAYEPSRTGTVSRAELWPQNE